MRVMTEADLDSLECDREELYAERDNTTDEARLAEIRVEIDYLSDLIDAGAFDNY